MSGWGVLPPSFADPAQESAFRREQARETVPIVRAGFLVGIPLWFVVWLALPLAAEIDGTVLAVASATMVALDLVCLWLVRGAPSLDLWGDTVNVASRLESTGVPGEIQASAATVDLLGGRFEVVPRGGVTLKGKGPMSTFLVRARREADASLQSSHG